MGLASASAQAFPHVQQFVFHSSRIRVSNGTPPNTLLPETSSLLRLLRILLLPLAACLVFPHTAAADVTYTYDDLNRIKTVRDATGASAEYVYDALGNILQVRQIGAGVLAVTGFAPSRSSVGASVTLNGSGFSATAASNTVRFNGVSAAVTAATTTRLTVTVPTSATTGPVSVTVGAVTATSLDSFTIVSGAGSLPPTITGFTPTSGVAGTAVSITGTNFDITPGSTRVIFNQTSSGSVSNVTATALTAVVPSSSASGPIRVLTPSGSATSSADFIIPPAGINAADIVSRLRATTGGASVSVVTNAASKVGLVLFDGVQNGYYSVYISSITTSPASSTVAWELYSPRGALVISGTVNTASPIHLPPLTFSGTHSLYFRPGAATVNLTASLKADTSIVSNGASLNASFSYSGQSIRHTFTGTAGQNLGLGISALTLSPTTSTYAGVSAYRPDGTYLNVSCYVYVSAGCNLNLSNLPTTGTYSVVVTPATGATGSFTATLSSDLTGTLTAGTPFALNLSRIGQNGRLGFSGTAGASVGLEIAGFVTVPAGKTAAVTIYKPDGTALTSVTATTPVSGGFVNLANLPSTGTYTVFIDPADVATASMRVTLEPGTALVVDGTSTSITLTTAGETARLSFSGTAGQNLGLGISALTLSPTTSTYAGVYVYRPDGTQLSSVVCYVSTGCNLNLSNLPSTGTYSVVVTPLNGATGSFTATLSSDLTGTLTAGTPFALNLNRIGQNGRLTFNGTAGQNLGLTLSSVVVTGSTSSGTLTVYKPDGTSLTTLAFSNGQFAAGGLSILPTTGTYTVFIDPPGAATVSMSVQLIAGVLATLALDSTPSNITLTQTGQTARLTFTGTAGQNLGIGISAFTLSPTTSTYPVVSAYRPDGTQLSSVICYVSTGCNLNLSNLPTTGTYSVVVTPTTGATGSATGSFTATLSSDLTGTFLLDSTPSNLTLARTGQTARLTFTGTAGQNLGLGISALTLTPATSTYARVYVYRPDGTQLSSVACYVSTGCNLNLSNLPSTGTYSVVVTPLNGATGSFTATLSSDLTGTLTAGTPFALNLNRIGQNGRLNFSGTAGQNLGLALSSLVISGSTAGGTLTVYKPDGTSLTSLGFSNGQVETSDLPVLPTTGAYTVFVDPPYAATASMSVLLSADVLATLALGGTASNVTLTQTGQTARLSFTATAGQNLGLGISALTLSPATSTYAEVRVYRPDGADVIRVTCYVSTGCNLNLSNLPSTGTYSVVVTPLSGATGNFTATLSSDLTGTLTAGTPFALNLSRIGQNGRLSFSGTAGQTRTLTFASIVTNPASQTVSFTVYRPDGVAYLSAAGATGTVTLNMATLPATGTYTLFVDPPNVATVTTSVTLSP